MSDRVLWDFTHRCGACGATVTVRAGKARRHICRLRWLGRRLARERSAAWLDGYQFGIEHIDEPMVAADREDFGSGWAAYLRTGQDAVTIHVDDADPSDPSGRVTT